MNSTPGSSIEELFGLTLSVSAGPTAVPVFITDFGSAFEGVVRVNSWSDLFQAARGVADTEGSGEVLRGYFANGGGHCYLANAAGTTVQQALALVERFNDVTILVPLGLWDGGADAAGEMARAVCAYAATHRAMAILHAGKDHDAQQARDAAIAFKLNDDQSAHAALYHPWLVPARSGAEPLPPVGAVAGVWCRVDRESGVWKAPTNVALTGAPLSQEVTDAQQDAAQPVNILRGFPVQGTLVLGARTLNETDDQWKYLKVRRLADSVERDLQQVLRWTECEPNNPSTWERVRAAVANYLHDIWSRDGLMGTTPEEAYFVHIGLGASMTDEDVKAGRLILNVGIAPMRPAEYIILPLSVTVER